MAITSALRRLRRALSNLLALETRQLTEVTPGEIAIEASWQMALEPTLSDLYWWPLRNGLQEAPEDDDGLYAWLVAAYRQQGATERLQRVMQRYQVSAVNVGGAAGLDLLGLGGEFALSNSGFLAELDAWAIEMTTVGGEMSLIDTTIDQLRRDIPAARADAQNTISVLAALIARRVAHRAPLIAETEVSRGFARGLNWTYRRNRVRQQVFMTRAGACVRICAPLHGTIMDVDNVPLGLLIPLHTSCRCYYEAVTDGWEAPEEVWRGE